MLEELTKQQQDFLPIYRDKWLKIGLSTEKCDRKKAEHWALEAYSVAKLEPPKIFLWARSPAECVYMSLFLKNVNKAPVRAQVGAQVRGQVEDQVRAQVGAQAWSQVWFQVRAQVGDQVGAQVRDQVGGQVGDQVRGQVWDRVGDQVRGQVGAQVEDQVWDRVRDQVGDQVRDQVKDQVWSQVWSQVGDQVRGQVGAQVWDQVRDQVWDQVWDQVRDQVRDQVWDQVWGQVEDQVWAQVGDQVRAQVRGQVWAQVRGQVWDRVRGQVGGQVRAQVRDQVGAQVGDQVGAQVYGCHDANWLGFYDYFFEVCKIKTKTRLKPLLEHSKHCGWWAPYRQVCILQEKPIEIHMKDKRLHNDNGPSVLYEDGFSVYSLNGVRVVKELVETPKEDLDLNKYFLAERNAEIRREVLRKVGVELLEHKLGSNLLDKKWGYELISLNLGEDVGEWPYLKMKNPSINTWHIEAVDKECKSVEQALTFRNFGKEQKQWIEPQKLT